MVLSVQGNNLNTRCLFSSKIFTVFFLLLVTRENNGDAISTQEIISSGESEKGLSASLLIYT